MKTLPITASFWILALTMSAMADTFILKDGTTVEGKILRQDATSYFVEVNITKSIKDERAILKADVTKIQREQPDLVAFEQLAKLVPAPDLLTADEYGQRIRAVEKFLTDHRGSDKTKDARAMLATLKAEANEVIAGGIKMNGRVVPPAEYRANAYDTDARIQEARIRALIKDARHLQALRAFSDFSRDFRNTSSHAAILPLINQLITSYLAEVGQSLATYNARVKEREVGLQRMPSAARVATENAIREETAELEARFKSEKDAKIGWVVTHPFFKPSLDETMSFGKQEINRLASLSAAPAVDGGKAYRDALGLIQSNGDAASISAAISTAKSALIAPRYIEILENAAKAHGATK
jgi:hypothetical protein